MTMTYPTVPVSIIAQANKGDPEAIQYILNHYQHYITRRSRRRMIDEYGHEYIVIDEVLLGRMQTLLIKKILSFEIK